MLGHEDLQSTEIYTHVAIRVLQQIHAATHPGAVIESKSPAAAKQNLQDEQSKAALLLALDAEADEEE
jgi:integrase/recombinase XerD